MDFIIKNKYLLIGISVLIAGFVWYGMSEKNSGDGLLTSESVGGGSVQSVAERELLDTLLELRAIKLDGQIFVNPAFGALRDFTTDIVSEPIGRRNPFAPLGEPGELFAPGATQEEQTTGAAGASKFVPGGFIQ
jgi:hypothetical protein